MTLSPLRIGVLVDVECRSGLGTGGQERITDITPTEIICGKKRYDRANGDALNAPFAYFIPGLPERGVVDAHATSAPIFSAAQARKLRDHALSDTQGQTLGPLLAFVHERIKRAAEDGRSEITHPFHRPDDTYAKFPGEWPRPEIADAIWAALTMEGYKVVHHPDPDPGHPGSGPYTSVSW